MNRHKAKIKSWNRFLIRNLVVAPGVIGQEHIFSFENSTVSIKIPSIDQVDRDKGFDEVASVGARRTVDNEPLEFNIHKIDVEVFIPITVSIPLEVLDQPANAYKLFSDEEQNRLNKITEQHQSIAEKAFEYWIRITRWVCDDSRIGRDQVEDFHSKWSTNLFDAERNKKVWIQGHVFYVLKLKTLKPKEWQEIQSKLSNGSQPPIYIELKHDAEESVRLGDYRRSLVDMTMACETFLRFAVLQKIPAELNIKLAAYIEKGSISQYIDKFFPEVIDEAANKKFKKLKSDLFKMFDRRNKLVHMGKDDGIDEKLCRKFLKVIQELISISNE